MSANNDDIIRMALEAGLERDGDNFFSKNYEEMDVHIDDLKRFAELARADEREAIADMVRNCDARANPKGIAAAIRARGNK